MKFPKINESEISYFCMKFPFVLLLHIIYLILLFLCAGCQIKKISSRGLYNVEKIERLQLHNNKLEEIKDVSRFSIFFLSALICS
jgi:hypothetical protein